LSEACIIKADYFNWRPVAGRKVLQLILEVPIEQTADVMKKLGVPMPGESKWVAVALLQNGACASESADGKQQSAPKPSEGLEAGDGQAGTTQEPMNVPSAKDGTLPAKDRRPFSSLPLSQQAGIRANDPDFQKFCGADSEDAAAKFIRGHCGITSRSELISGSAAALNWFALERQFASYLTTQRYAESAR